MNLKIYLQSYKRVMTYPFPSEKGECIIIKYYYTIN